MPTNTKSESGRKEDMRKLDSKQAEEKAKSINQMTQNNKCHNPKHIYSPHYPCACNMDSMPQNNKPQCCEKCKREDHIEDGVTYYSCSNSGCPCHSPHRDMEGWARGFEKLNDQMFEDFGSSLDYDYEKVKDFIRQAVAQARKVSEETKQFYYNRGYEDARQAERTRILGVIGGMKETRRVRDRTKMPSGNKIVDMTGVHDEFKNNRWNFILDTIISKIQKK